MVGVVSAICVHLWTALCIQTKCIAMHVTNECVEISCVCVVHSFLMLTPLLTCHSKHTVQFEMLKTLTNEVDTANQ